MVKKILILLCLLIPTLAKADTSIFDVIASVPALNQGFAVSFADSNINYLSTVDFAKWNGFNLEAGYAGRAKETGDKVVAVLSYELLNLEGKTTWPILNFVDFKPGIWVGIGRIGGSNEIDYGVSATVVSFKF